MEPEHFTPEPEPKLPREKCFSLCTAKQKCITDLSRCPSPLYVPILHRYPTGQLNAVPILSLTRFLCLTNIHFRILVQYSINTEAISMDT